MRVKGAIAELLPRRGVTGHPEAIFLLLNLNHPVLVEVCEVWIFHDLSATSG
ncbi:MAG: hypothetical protein HC839_04020 [Leptolyngbyaceae cyanobacterium RM2_2_21]|nr:hypothetical protein [Leptolyngbyaceae cyanobacterium RM2_2_21]